MAGSMSGLRWFQEQRNADLSVCNPSKTAVNGSSWAWPQSIPAPGGFLFFIIFSTLEAGRENGSAGPPTRVPSQQSGAVVWRGWGICSRQAALPLATSHSPAVTVDPLTMSTCSVFDLEPGKAQRLTARGPRPTARGTTGFSIQSPHEQIVARRCIKQMLPPRFHDGFFFTSVSNTQPTPSSPLFHPTFFKHPDFVVFLNNLNITTKHHQPALS